jgi:hypothetical protein
MHGRRGFRIRSVDYCRGKRTPATEMACVHESMYIRYILFSFIGLANNMTTPSVRKPTKSTFHFPKSAEPGDETVASTDAGTAADTAAKPRQRAARARRVDAETKAAEIVKKAAEAVAEAVAEEVAVKGKAKREKKEGVKKVSTKKEKVVRDSFTMPKTDYEKLAILKKKCLDAGVAVKKSELLRAGLKLLESTSEKRLLAAIAAVETVKTGRPSKSA